VSACALFVSGALSGAVVNPVEVLKVRSQSMGGLTGHQHKQMENIYRAAIALMKDEGYRGFFRGIEVQVVRGFLGAGTQLPAYAILKTKAGELGYDTTNPLMHVACSALSAGTLRSCSTTPFACFSNIFCMLSYFKIWCQGCRSSAATPRMWFALACTTSPSTMQVRPADVNRRQSNDFSCVLCID
jgi:hypothetical protein